MCKVMLAQIKMKLKPINISYRMSQSICVLQSDSVTFSSSVTIYSDFHFDQDVDLLRHVTSCL